MRALLAGTVVLLIVTAGCLSAPSLAAEPVAESTTGPTVSVGATGTASAPPDLAVVRVAVEARADSADAARAAVARDADRMRAALRDLGLAEDAVRTAYFSVAPEYDYTRERRELVGYRAVHAFEVESEVDAAGDVIDTAVGNGADRVDSVSFTLAEETRREVRAEALERAMSSARADADGAATAAGTRVTGVRSVSVGDAGFVPFAARAEADAGGAATTIDPADVTVTVRVDAVYAMG